ncbi:hypothetical protein AMJ40_05540 [candidate division TA06 bacterium DG_26]|uniref:Uncharacterized protein n=1 Tax=candidate division TA06 bacterium DG_26 TaxID=1703771 RepID=A0A0S7WH32_UNCT6|nr:MAG: hypothetical protein AMJ40_05540 [candidate division TA06 bacterium DG_26]
MIESVSSDDVRGFIDVRRALPESLSRRTRLGCLQVDPSSFQLTGKSLTGVDRGSPGSLRDLTEKTRKS